MNYYIDKRTERMLNRWRYTVQGTVIAADVALEHGFSGAIHILLLILKEIYQEGITTALQTLVKDIVHSSL